MQKISERTGGMDYRSVLRCSAQCVRYRWLPLHAGVDAAPAHYLTTYVGTPVAGVFRTDGGYTLLMAVTRKVRGLALDNEVEPFVTEKGESTLR